MVLGYFGKTPLPPDPEIVKRASELMELEPTERAPIDINDEDPRRAWTRAKAMLDGGGPPPTDENVFIAATCKEKGVAFLAGRGEGQRSEEGAAGGAEGRCRSRGRR